MQITDSMALLGRVHGPQEGLGLVTESRVTCSCLRAENVGSQGLVQGLHSQMLPEASDMNEPNVQGGNDGNPQRPPVQRNMPVCAPSVNGGSV